MKKKRVRCSKCGNIVSVKSMFAISLARSQDGDLINDVVKASTVVETDTIVHIGADRECTKPIPGFKKKILDVLGITDKVDMTFLD